MKIEKVTKEDINDLSSLYEIVWPDVTYDKKAKAKWIIEYSRGIHFCAKENDKIIGSRTSCLYNTYFGDKPLQCLHIGDSCVHPDYQGRGIFKKMNQSLLENFFPNGDLIYNVSVYASRRQYEKLGWKYIDSLCTLRKIQKPISVFRKVKWHLDLIGGNIHWDSLNSQLMINEDLLKSREIFFCNSDKPLIHNRYTSDIMKWREKSYSGIKVFSEEIGSIIYKSGLNDAGIKVLYIGEVFLRSYNYINFKRIIKDLVKYISSEIVQITISLGHPLYKWYKRMNFISNPKQKYLNLGVRVDSEKMLNIARNPYNWAISSLDIDTF